MANFSMSFSSHLAFDLHHIFSTYLLRASIGSYPDISPLIRHYLDDFLNIFKPETPMPTLHAALEWSRTLANALGLSFQESKIEGPSTCLEFLGIELDSMAMEARLPAEKLSYLTDILVKWRSKSHCTLHELQELTGYLQFCSQIIPFSKAFLPALFDFSVSFHNPFARRRITRPARRDLNWWLTYSSAWNGIHLIVPDRPTLHVYTDASGSKGAGGTLGNRWFSCRIPHRYSIRDIKFKELYAIIHAILCWGPLFSGHRVVFHTDNQNVHSALQKLSIRSAPTMELLRQFLGLASLLDFTFVSSWLPSKANTIADAASRFQFSHMFSIAPHLSLKSSSKVLFLKSLSFSSKLRPVASLQ
jgi:hypothetical protein